MASAAQIIDEQMRKLQKREKLSERLAEMLLDGVKQAGSYDPTKALLSVEEKMTGREYKLATAFLQWCHENKMTFGRGGLTTRWNEYCISLENKADAAKEKAACPVFLVTVTRTAHGSREFRVTGAKDDIHASQVAWEKAGNFSFSEKSSEYTVDGIIAIDAGTSTNVEEIKA